eukprot:366044-Chlamydomonas_euryale.AAC.11
MLGTAAVLRWAFFFKASALCRAVRGLVLCSSPVMPCPTPGRESKREHAGCTTAGTLSNQLCNSGLAHCQIDCSKDVRPVYGFQLHGERRGDVRHGARPRSPEWGAGRGVMVRDTVTLPSNSRAARMKEGVALAPPPPSPSSHPRVPAAAAGQLRACTRHPPSALTISARASNGDGARGRERASSERRRRAWRTPPAQML